MHSEFLGSQPSSERKSAFAQLALEADTGNLKFALNGIEPSGSDLDVAKPLIHMSLLRMYY